MGQDRTVNAKLNEIDSLIQNRRLVEARRKSDSLFQFLNNANSPKKQGDALLEVRYRQALILDRQDSSPAQVLQRLLEIKDEAEARHLHALTYRTLLSIALSHEKAENYDLTALYLDLAYRQYGKHNLESLFSTYCIRKASFHRFKHELDSMLHYANMAANYAEKYNNETDRTDSYTLLGSFHYRSGNYAEASKYQRLLLDHHKKTNDTAGTAVSYVNITSNQFKTRDYPNALAYADSAIALIHGLSPSLKATLYKSLAEGHEALNNTDSAFHYFKQYHHQLQVQQEEEEKLKTKSLEEQYQNAKKEAIIRSKEEQVALIGFLLAVIALATAALIKKNRQINKQNKIISKQLEELMKTLEQKQILLSELQHRVKNNLQHVISILEIQKESVDFNNIDELLRGNQNRIHSMALLHKKLNVSDNVNDVDLARYVAELAALVKDSYDNHKKRITLEVSCDIEIMSIEKALPLGLIIVELVSNSMKHAFKKRNTGRITIALTKDDLTNSLRYTDNGEGFDFNKTSEKGLGQEIIKGLIDQLDGETETRGNNGFELTVLF